MKLLISAVLLTATAAFADQAFTPMKRNQRGEFSARHRHGRCTPVNYNCGGYYEQLDLCNGTLYLRGTDIPFIRCDNGGD